jgi:hypothetical protein
MNSLFPPHTLLPWRKFATCAICCFVYQSGYCNKIKNHRINNQSFSPLRRFPFIVPLFNQGMLKLETKEMILFRLYEDYNISTSPFGRFVCRIVP